jgi:hemolysin activation/secretion protein
MKTIGAMTGAGLSLALAPAFAQSVPDAGQLLRQIQPQTPVLPPDTLPQPKPVEPVKHLTRDTRFTVSHFRITGAVLVPEAEIQEVLKPYLNHEITFDDLEKALVAISQLYQSHGWLARPLVPAQDIVGGVVTIQILEGKLGAVQLKKNGAPHISDARVLGTMTKGQEPGTPLRLDRMGRAVNVLNDTPGIAASAVLAPGDANGTTDIVLSLDEKPLVNGSAMADNGGPHSTGEFRFNGNVNLESPMGLGDEFVATGMASLGMQYGRLAYTLPVGYDGLRVGVNLSGLRYALRGKTFDALDAQGDAMTLGLTASYPLLRTDTNSVQLGAEFDYKHLANTAHGIVTSRKSIYVANIVLSGDIVDRIAGGGLTFWNVNLAIGDLDLSGDAANRAADRLGPHTAGGYARLAATIARLQRLTEKDTLWVSLSAQQAFKNLDSSEKFWLGGPQGVRAFPVSEASGDSGWLTTVEFRHAFTSEWQASVFYDHGSIMLNHNAGFNLTPLSPNHYGLDGIGAGIAYLVPGSYAIRATVSHALSRNPAPDPVTGNDSDGTRADTRYWITASYFF